MPSFVVAIAGGSASGKSTFADVLAEAFRRHLPDKAIEVLPMDRFMRRDDLDAPHFFFNQTGQSTFSANHPESVDNANVLQAIEASSADIVIFEGLMALVIQELRDIADLKLFIDLDADIRVARRMERDIRTKRGGGDPTFIAAYYIECARVGHHAYVEPSKVHADFILRGDGDFERSSELVARMIAANSWQS